MKKYIILIVLQENQMINSKKAKILSLLIVCIFGFFTFGQEAHAYDTSGIMKKWVFTLYYGCTKTEIQGGRIENEINKKESGKVMNDVFPDDNPNYSEYNDGNDLESNRYLPSYNLLGPSNGPVTCKEVFQGLGDLAGKGVLDYYDNGSYKDTTWTSSGQEANTFLTNIGYVQSNNPDSRTFTIQADVQQSDYEYSYGERRNETSENGSATWTFTVANGEISVVPEGEYGLSIISIGDNKITVKPPASYPMLGEDTEEITEDINPYDADGFFNALKELQGKYITVESRANYREMSDTGEYNYYTVSSLTYHFGTPEEISDGSYMYAANRERALWTSRAIVEMSGQRLTDQNLTESEKYTLYYHYLDNAAYRYAQPKMTCNSDAINTSEYTEVKLKDTDGEFKTCYVKFSSADVLENTVYIQSSDTNTYPFIAPASIQDIINWFNNDMDPSKLDDSIPIVGEVEDTADDEEHDLCYEAAGDMSWQLCSLMQNIANGASSLYKQIVEPFLRIEPVLLKTEGATGQA